MFGSILVLASSVARAASKYHLLLRDPHFSVIAILVSLAGDQGGTSTNGYAKPLMSTSIKLPTRNFLRTIHRTIHGIPRKPSIDSVRRQRELGLLLPGLSRTSIAGCSALANSIKNLSIGTARLVHINGESQQAVESTWPGPRRPSKILRSQPKIPD